MSEDATVRDEVDEVDDLVTNHFYLYQYQVDCSDFVFPGRLIFSVHTLPNLDGFLDRPMISMTLTT